MRTERHADTTCEVLFSTLLRDIYTHAYASSECAHCDWTLISVKGKVCCIYLSVSGGGAVGAWCRTYQPLSFGPMCLFVIQFYVRTACAPEGAY